MSAAPTAASPLGEWLSYLETLHPKSIAMGLERVAAVGARLGLRFSCPVITVTGTNGKGSVCAMIEAVLRAGGYRAGLYTSPHLLRYNERIRIAGQEVEDAALCAAFAEVDAARHETPLTYFEFGTLAALRLFGRARLDALILEVGLGGRLDAVNIIDADVAVVSGIAIDHVDYLGETRESIGFEKAGIMRAGRPVICADPQPPESLLAHASAIGANLLQIGEDFGYVVRQQQWDYWVRHEAGLVRRHGLPLPALRGSVQVRNAATALTALDAVAAHLPVSMGAIREAMVSVNWPARFQVLPGQPAVVLDVAHNPQAAGVLAANLGDMGFFSETIAVFSMLGDKDIVGVAAAMRSRIDRWLIAPSAGTRGTGVAQIRAALVMAGVQDATIIDCVDVRSALLSAFEQVGEADRIVAFGSFGTVASALSALDAIR